MSQPPPKKPFEVILREDGALEIISDNYRAPTPDEIAAKKLNSARCGHVKRRLKRDERLKGELLEFAIDVAGKDSDIAKKLETGEKLTDYELHLMLDVYLLHQRLSG